MNYHTLPFLQLKKLFFVVALVYCCTLSPTGIKPAFSDSQNTILVYGDSLSTAYGLAKTNGWVQLLKDKLSNKHPSWQVINLSVSGQTTGGALPKLASYLKLYQPKFLVLELGGNDGLRGIPLPFIERNLNKMIEVSNEHQVETLLFGINLPSNYGPAYSNKFHKIYQDLAKKHSLAWIPSFLAPLAERPDLFQPDGIHPKAEAQRLLFDHIWPLINSAILNLNSSIESKAAFRLKK